MARRPGVDLAHRDGTPSRKCRRRVELGESVASRPDESQLHRTDQQSVT
jgi:hypothetical protein